MAKIVVTSGTRFTDIDALACAIAYRELPPQPPLVVLPGPLNQSVTLAIRNWNLGYLTDVRQGDFDFVVVDVSEESQLADFVAKDRVIALYDHHFGFEKNWRRLGDKAKIEAVGACATLLWEEARRNERPISSLAANLLATAIVSNTLNFQSSLTTDRDKQAFAELKPYVNLPGDWIIQYYLAQEVAIYLDPIKAVKSDTKIQKIKGKDYAVGQMELWNSKDFLAKHEQEIGEALAGFPAAGWFFTSPCISEGRNYLFTRDETLKKILSQALTINFTDDIGVTDKLWLRKEILKKIQ